MFVMCVQNMRRLSFPLIFFFKQKTAYEMRISDWSSDVCSSDLSCVWLQPCRLRARRTRLPICRGVRASSVMGGLLSRSDKSSISGSAHKWQICARPYNHYLSELSHKACAGGAGPGRKEPGHDCLCPLKGPCRCQPFNRSEEHTSDLQSLMRISY